MREFSFTSDWSRNNWRVFIFIFLPITKRSVARPKLAKHELLLTLRGNRSEQPFTFVSVLKMKWVGREAWYTCMYLQLIPDGAIFFCPLTHHPKHGSRSMYFTTGPGPPMQFTGQVISDMDIHLSWKEPLNSNGIVRFYYIRIYDTKTGQQVKSLVNKTAVKQDRPQWQRISSLKPFTSYTFTIQAVTIKPGEMSNFTTRTDEGGNIFFAIFNGRN